MCVQYLNAGGAAYPSSDTVEGAPFFCIQALADAANGNQKSITMKTYSHEEFACWDNYSSCTGTKDGGTAFPTGTEQVWKNGAGVLTDGLDAAAVSEVEWFQPKATSDY